MCAVCTALELELLRTSQRLRPEIWIDTHDRHRYHRGSVNITKAFFDDFADQLVSALLIVSYLNVHLDEETDQSTINFQHLLAAHGLVQHVVPTATRTGRHTLDVTIT